MEDKQLTKKQRKELKKQEWVGEFATEKRMKLIKNCFIGILLVLLIGGGSWWLYKESSKPLPGKAVADQGRKHVTQSEWSKFRYNSNPPTSGPHGEVWVKKGIYNTPQGEGNLVHSLEHGYIIVSYNCGTFPGTYNREKLTGTESASMNDPWWNNRDCNNLKTQLTDIANELTMWKFIVVPRPQLDVLIALTAWTRLEKLQTVDKQKIRDFTNAYRDHGPEQTMEP